MPFRFFAPIILVGLLQACGDDARDFQRGESAMQAGNYAEAYCLWRPLADEGHSDAQYNVGWMYANGYGLALDEAEAVRWWRLAAQKSHADAQFALANAYLNGEGVEQDPAQAVAWLGKAATQGVEDAGAILRDMAGRGIESAVALLRDLLVKQAWRGLGGIRRVKPQRANVRDGMSKDRDLVVGLDQGTEVVVLQEKSDWVRIGIPGSGQLGWVYGPLLEEPPME